MKGYLAVFICLQITTSSHGAGFGRISNVDTTNSDITVIKIKPIISTDTEANRPNLKTNYRSSRIENLPLQIKPISTQTNTADGEKTDVIRTPRSSDFNLTTSDGDKNANDTAQIATEIENNESEARFDLSEALTPYPTDSADYKIDSETTTPRTTTVATDSSLFKKSYANKIYSVKNKYSKKFFYGSGEVYDSAYKKYIETRRFRSRCRCEKIWNCPKLQLSVPRCPEEYFMCCF